MIKENVKTGQFYRVLSDKVNKVWDRLSFWTKASDVEFNDGSSLETFKSTVETFNSKVSIPVVCTQAQYDQWRNTGQLDSKTFYYVKKT